MPPAPKEPGWRRHAAWLCVALAYVVVFPFFGKLNNPNENVRVWMTRALVEHGTFRIDAVERAWGAVSDRATFEGRHLSTKAPGTSLLGVPVHFVHAKISKLASGQLPSQRATTWGLRVFSVALPLAAFLYAFARAVERETGSPWARDLLVVGLGLGTLMYPYGLMFVGHAQAGALVFGAYLAMRKARDDGRPGRWLGLAGALAGLAVLFEYQVLVAVAVVSVFVVMAHRRRAAFYFLGALGPAVLLGAVHTATFGAPWAFPYAHVDDPLFRLYHSQGVLFGFGRPHAQVLVDAFFTAEYGLFVFSPFLAVGLGAAVVGAVKDARADFLLVSIVVVAMALFLSGMSNWRAGWCAAGPRYIASVAPFLAWALAMSWQRFWQHHPWPAAALAGLVGASVFSCAIAGAHFPHYPLQFDNPIFQASLPLLREGFVPYSLGTAIGLRGLASLLPWVFLVVGAVLFALPRSGSLRIAGALGVAALFVTMTAALGRAPEIEREQALTFMRAIWEPPAGPHGTF